MKLKNINKIGVSVVIITYNGEARIEKTLKYLSKQKNIDFNWEVLIVDNNSTDNTGIIAMNYWIQLGNPCPLHVIKEVNPGQMYARNNGIINSKYRYLLFCDDDNWLNEYYVKYAFDSILNYDNIAAIGGCGILEFEDKFSKPDWIDTYAGKFGAGPQGKEDGDITDFKGSLYTAGSIFDRKWLDKLYSCGFKPLLPGRDGKSLIGGEDTEITYALRTIGGRIYYYSDLKFLHFMPTSRITWAYLLRLSKAMEAGSYLLRPYNSSDPINVSYDFIKTILLIIKYYIKSIVSGFKEGDENMIYFYMFIGRIQALLIAKKHHRETIKIIEKLKNCNL